MLAVTELDLRSVTRNRLKARAKEIVLGGVDNPIPVLRQPNTHDSFRFGDIFQFLGRERVWFYLKDNGGDQFKHGLKKILYLSKPTLIDHVGVRFLSTSSLSPAVATVTYHPVFHIPKSELVLLAHRADYNRKVYYWSAGCIQKPNHPEKCGCVPLDQYELPVSVEIDYWMEKLK